MSQAKVGKILVSFTVTLFLAVAGATTTTKRVAETEAEAGKTAPVAKLPLNDFFKNPQAANFTVSPSGQQIGFMQPQDNRMNIFIRPSGGGEARALTHVKDRDLTGYYWKTDNYILYLKDDGGDENYHLYKIDLKTGVNTDLTPFQNTRAHIEDLLLNTSRNEIVISHNQRDAKLFDIYRVNLETNKLKLVYKNPGDVSDYLFDHKGHLRVASRTVGTSSEILYRDGNVGAFKPILTFDYKSQFIPLMFTSDDQRILALSNFDSDRLTLVELDPKSNKSARIVYQHPSYDLWPTLLYSRLQKKLMGVSVMTWKLEYAFFDPAWEKAFQILTDRVGVANLNLASVSDNEQKMVFSISSDRIRERFYLLDRDTNKVELLSDTTPWLMPEQMAEMKPIQYQSRDGLLINGYITLPVGKVAQNLPFIINPHGGPWARDTWRFSSETQFLANRGYGILKMNFRGSTGYGRKFWTSSFKQWGLSMQDDVTDGVKWLIDQGIADPKRICIYGGSYGGFTTLSGLVKTPDLYRCGVDYVGVANLFTFLQTIPPYWETEREKLYAMVGHPEADKAQLTQTSPALNAGKIKVPLLIAQGAKDPRVNKNESDQMVAALKKRGIEVPYMVKENEGHGFRNEENRFDFYGEMEKFFAKHLR